MTPKTIDSILDDADRILTSLADELENPPIVLHLSPAIELSAEQFFEICQLNRELRIERNATGEITIMSPAGSGSGNRNAKLNQQLANWTDSNGTGIEFDSSAGFTLPNGAARSPDAAWIELARWNAIPVERQEKFAPIAPDFVVELRSPSDRLKPLQEKMQEYIDNGVKLGWLIDRKRQRVYIYRPGMAVERLDRPDTVSGDPILPGFILNLSKIW